MADHQLSAGQKFAVRYLGDWKFGERHSNGDVTVLIGEGVNQQKIRIAVNGTTVTRTSASGEVASNKPVQHNLGEEIFEELKKPVQKFESKLLRKPNPEQKPAKEEKYHYNPTPVYSKTVCQESPACCKPKDVLAVFWDADHTIWNMPGTAASVTGKLKKIDDDTVVEIGNGFTSYYYPELPKFSKWNIEEYLSPEEASLLFGLSADEKDFLLDELAKEYNATGKQPVVEAKPAKSEEKIMTTIKLFPTFRKTLDELDKRGIPSSIISLNTPGSVRRILKEFGIDHRFKEIRDSYENKGRVFANLTHKFNICPCETIFVDDNRGNVQDVADKCGVSLQIGQGKDIEEPIEVLKYIKG